MVSRSMGASRVVGGWLAMLTVGIVISTTSAQEEAGVTGLELSNVSIFSSGVALFEHSGVVEGDVEVVLNFRTAQINDILKSLVVQDFDGGTVSVVNYASRDPISRTLKSFAVDITGDPSFGELLDQLRGEPVAIAAPRQLSGTIVGVEAHERKDDGAVITEYYLTVLTPDGLETLNLHDLRGVVLQNDDVASELQKALATLAQGRDADRRSVRVKFEGDGPRRVRILYLHEAPIWKTSYRLVLDEESEAFLQGWATVDNTTEEDWNDVRLSLASGRPISFQMDLYTPLYVPRPVEQLERYASLRPPTYEGELFDRPEMPPLSSMAEDRAFPAVASETAESKRGVARVPGRRSADERHFFGGGQGGFAAGSFVATQAAATGSQAGELFHYTLDNPVSVPRQRSAMLPILGETVTATKVSIFNTGTHPKHPLNGVELKNASDLNLVQGPITVFDGGSYAGDAKLPSLQPGEERLIAYALDLPVEVAIKNEQSSRRSSFRIDNGTLRWQVKLTQGQDYRIVNRDADPRTVIIETPDMSGWQLIEPQKPDSETRNTYRFKVAVAGDDEETLPLRFERTVFERLTLASANLETIEYWISQRGTGGVSDDLRAALESVRERRLALARLERELAEVEQTLRDAMKQQERVRENLRVLPKDSDQHVRQLEQFDAYETQIENSRSRASELREQIEAAKQALEDYLQNLNVD